MTAAAAPRPRIVLAPFVRFARILWRLLPWLAFAGVLVFGTWLLGGSTQGTVQVAVVGLIIVAWGLLRAVITELFSPDRPGLRILPVSDGRARRLAGTFRALAFFFLLTSLGAGIVQVNGWHGGVADALLVLQSVVLVLTAAVLLSSSGLVRRLRDVQGDGPAAALSRFAAKAVFPILVITALVYVVLNGLGFTPLALWIVRNVGWAVLKLLAGFVVMRWLRRTLARIVRFYREDREMPADPEDEGEPGVDTVAIGIERIVVGNLRAVIGFLVALWILQGWNLPPGLLLEGLSQPMFGTSGPTWGQLLGGILSVGGVLYVGWLIRSILTYFVFPRSRISVGARYAILAILRYIVIAFAIVFALGALGIDTSSFGWFFGAAGVGIGFGLQDVIGNFISGLIMLVERPIRVGDWVTIGEATGTVEAIHMRGTTLRTFDNTTVLIPNRQLLGERVTNLTHGMSRKRIRIPVGVAYGTDPARVEQILVDVAEQDEDVLVDPEPWVMFDAFGASSLDFFLICFTDKTRGALGVTSRLRTEILRRLRDAGVEIPFPQQDLHIRSGLHREGS